MRSDLNRLHIRLCLPCPPPERQKWGDYYFARSLARVFKSRGHTVSMNFVRKRPWLHKLRRVFSTLSVPDVDLVIRGKVPYAPVRGRPTLMWMISNADSISRQEIESMDHVFVASRKHCEALARQGHGNVSVLLQCTDQHVFSPQRRSDGCRTAALFVGNRRDFERPVVEYALKAGVPLSVWGRNWEAVLPKEVLMGTHLENENLGAYYASAGVVLNDHTPDMARNGFTSNRVFDVLASGAPVISDLATDLPEELASLVYTFNDYSSFVRAYKSASAEGENPQQRRLHMAECVRRDHSFAVRAIEIEDKALELIKRTRCAERRLRNRAA